MSHISLVQNIQNLQAFQSNIYSIDNSFTGLIQKGNNIDLFFTNSNLSAETMSNIETLLDTFVDTIPFNIIVKQQSIPFTYIENSLYELFYGFMYLGTIKDPGFNSISLNSLIDNSQYYIRIINLTDNVIMTESTFSNQSFNYNEIPISTFLKPYPMDLEIHIRTVQPNTKVLINGL